MILDDWQKEVLSCKGNIVLRSGRQVGKSTVISIKASEYAINNPKHEIMVLAAVERQAYLLFEKILGYLTDNYKSQICKGAKRPTKHVIHLKNGAIIRCLPTGLTGYGIRGFTIHLLIVDEAAFVQPEVFQAITPMMAVTGGKIILLSTPFGREGYFYDCFNDDSFSSFHISAEDCPRHSKEFLEREKKRMTKAQYAQEYLGEFVDELRQWFPTELIKKCMIIERNSAMHNRRYDPFLGVDIAAMGEDETVLVSVDRIERERIKMFDMLITTKTRLTNTIEAIKNADKLHHYKRIYIDDGGIGSGVYDVLLDTPSTGRRVEAINNSRRSLDKKQSQTKRLMKEDLYNNLLRMMEQGKVELFDEPEIMLSLKSVQYEYVDGRLKIFGNYTHIAEALVRAAWCIKDKHLNIWVC